MRQLFSFALMILSGSGLVFAEGTPDRLQHSREIVREFGGQLKHQLQSAMKEGGPVQAISVCKDAAPSIALGLSGKVGAQVGRTSLKLRNTRENAPDAWQQAVLREFDASAAAGAIPATLEKFEVQADGSARYMKAIPVQPLCLSCHGTALDSHIKDALAKNYPDDQATGYKLGDIRGAFRIDWPATDSGSH